MQGRGDGREERMNARAEKVSERSAVGKGEHERGQARGTRELARAQKLSPKMGERPM